MTNREILEALDRAGEAMKASGERSVSLRLNDDDTFTVGVAEHGGLPDTFGHSDRPSAAFIKALAGREKEAA